MIDRYTKVALTIIAGALTVIAAQGFFQQAGAQIGRGCGSDFGDPCFIRTYNPIDVKIVP